MGSDIREDKNTLLKIKAMDSASPQDRRFLKKAYGNRNLTKKEIKGVREITVATGALDYSQKLARKLVNKAKKHVGQITADAELQDTLFQMADFMIERES